MSALTRPGCQPSTVHRPRASENGPPAAPPKLPTTEPAIPKKAQKPPKPRKVERRRRGRKG